MKASVLLNMGQLLESAIAVGALVGLLSGVHPDVLNQLVIWWESFETLLALVWFGQGSTFRARTGSCSYELPMLPEVVILGLLNRCRLLLLLQLHCRFVHENLQTKQIHVLKSTTLNNPIYLLFNAVIDN